jgi:predicted RNA-binding Zn ribbon-like protein
MATGRAKPAAARRVLRRTHALRQALHVVLLDVAAGAAPNAEQLRLLEAEVARIPLRLTLSPDGGLDWQWDDPEAPIVLDRVLWPVVWHAVDLLRAPDGVRHVKSCAADTCGWLFLDESRRGNRKWCDMADCGNRAKVRRYYRRHRKA